MTDFVTQVLRIARSKSTLESDTSTLLRMYAPAPDASQTQGRGKNQTEDHLDTPMSQLRLIERTGANRGYRSPRTARPFLPPVALHFALAECFADGSGQPALPVRDLLYGGDDHAAPGAVFRLSEEGLMTALSDLMQHWPGRYELRDTAGLHQLCQVARAAQPIDVLRAYYRKAAA